MQKAKRVMLLVVILGLLAALPASAQVEPMQDEDGSNLGLLVMINRLELTPTQMQQVHDVLAGVLNEANALKKSREPFEQEMIRFNGTQEELDALLEAFREEQSAQATALRDSVEKALDELKNILTFKQGETLGNMLSHLIGMWPTTITLREEQLGAGRLGRLPQVMGERLSPEMRERVMGRLRERIGDENTEPDQFRQFLAKRPELQDRLMAREQSQFKGLRQLDGRCPFSSITDWRFGLEDHPFQMRQLGDRGLSWLEHLVETLEMKLQYVE